MSRPLLALALLSLLSLLSGAAEAAPVLRADGTIDWTRYHDNADASRLLRELSARYPRLARVYSIGKSFQGRDLLMLELTSSKSGPPGEKPGYYIDGGVHACELAGSEMVLYLAWSLATRHGKDPAITRLLDTHTVYLRPKFNPDGADHCLTHPDGLRSTVRPWDDDGDGALDEDPAEDLDGDGAITSMRVPSPKGRQKLSPEDPRIMVDRKEGESGGHYYRVVTEGTDSDGDGELNEDGVGGIDMNRNFPRTWGLPYQQSGAGPFPLSEPETRATLDFLVSHPNVTGIVHNHTSGGFLYRLPSTNPPADHAPDDLALVKLFGDRFTAITGQPVRDSYSGEGSSRHGTLISWGYFDYGVLGWVPEHWGGVGKDYNQDGRVSELERLRWNDEELGGAGFAPWKPFEHPQLGPVEIGGWRRKFTSQNPPGKLLEAELAKKVPWLVALIDAAPLVKIAEARSTAEPGGHHRIDVQVANEGFLPTNITTRALEARLAKPVRARLTLKGAQLVSGKTTVDLGHIPGTRALPAAGSAAPNRRTVTWVVEAPAKGARVEVTVVSEKGGTDRLTITLP